MYDSDWNTVQIVRFYHSIQGQWVSRFGWFPLSVSDESRLPYHLSASHTILNFLKCTYSLDRSLLHYRVAASEFALASLLRLSGDIDNETHSASHWLLQFCTRAEVWSLQCHQCQTLMDFFIDIRQWWWFWYWFWCGQNLDTKSKSMCRLFGRYAHRLVTG